MVTGAGTVLPESEANVEKLVHGSDGGGDVAGAGVVTMAVTAAVVDGACVASGVVVRTSETEVVTGATVVEGACVGMGVVVLALGVGASTGGSGGQAAALSGFGELAFLMFRRIWGSIFRFPLFVYFCTFVFVFYVGTSADGSSC